MSMSAKPRSTRNNIAQRHSSLSQSSQIDNALGADILGFCARVADVLQAASHPIPLSQLVEQMRPQCPAKENVAVLVQKAINQLYQAVPMPSGKIGWLAHLLRGSRIRHPLTADEVERGFLLMDELEHAAFFPEFFQSHRSTQRSLQVELFGGPTIPAEAYIERKTWSLSLGEQFVEWLDAQGGQEGDDLIIMVDDAATGHYTLRLHPREARDSNLIHNHNIHLALLAEELVRAQSNEQDVLPTWHLAAQLIAHQVYAADVPPDDLHCVLHQYSLIHYMGTGYTAKPTDTSVDRTKQMGQSGGSTDSVPSSKSSGTILNVPAAGKNEEMGKEDAMNITDAAWESDQYQDYLDRLYESGRSQMPLPPHEFALLIAELDALSELEDEFGYLLGEQQKRLQELYTGLLIDENTWEDDFDLWDDDDTYFDAPDLENPFS